jgi:malate-CoA ligase subunit beta
MDIHEYQGKQLLARYGVAVPKGNFADNAKQAIERAHEIGGSKWVVKAQIHSGARGKAGGIKVVSSEAELAQAAESLLGKRLVTVQTGPAGKLVSRLYIEAATDIAKEYYLSYVIDRRSEQSMVVASAAGGMDIEEVAAKQPESIIRLSVDPGMGLQPFQARGIAVKLGFPADQIGKAAELMVAAYKAFVDLDATMLEINPLVADKAGKVLALDVKASFDDNAMFRHSDIAQLRDKSQEDPRETHASDQGLAYVGLDGRIGCIINGAGLAMATLDMIKLAGGEPANFLDIGGGASPERVAKSFRAVLQDPKVETILVNIFAGINRCDWVAEGVIKAIEEVGIPVPLVVRLEGTNQEQGLAILKGAKHPIITASTLAEAANKAVAAWKDFTKEKERATA